ncbi:hypothetical protein HYN48_05490 [Flavobacterium magnum]|uniref:Uncharacterized protein n=1 Tax=Flavobacterium magnum TaxID=2162713 RepID=A0A2S0RD68_9FLAO|nr:SusE domain-containing protein [Flavobacterium magnum]AWA29584.1 hypothetical protein HYN48_05490 [Flavobacterium magnum]
MKNTFKILAAFIMISGLWSCESEDNFMIAEPQANAFAILTPDTGTAVTITEATPTANTALTLTWEDVTYGTPTLVNYTVEFALNGTDFANPTVITTVPDTRYAMTFADLDAKAKALVTTPEIPYDGSPIAIDVRIKSSIGTTASEEKYSEVTTIVVTSFIPTNPPLIDYPQLYLVGPASEAGWANGADNQPMFRDANNDKLFILTAYFNAGQLKFLAKYGQWAPQYGGGGGFLVFRPTESDPDPSPIDIATAGYYTVTVDTQALTYSIVPYDASGAASFDSVGIIGTGTSDDWTSDQNLTATPQNPHLWKARGLELTAENVKFRANDQWALPGNWGAGTFELFGKTSIDGGDFKAVDVNGTYDVYFNDLDGRYAFLPAQQ